MERSVIQYFACIKNLFEEFDFHSCVTNKTRNLYEAQVEISS
jgi:hypothetical protein